MHGAVGVLVDFQVGLTVMYFISALSIGVALPGWPATILVCQ
jgi:hypothetical protein